MYVFSNAKASENRGTLLGGPFKGLLLYLGYIRGYPYSGNTHIGTYAHPRSQRSVGVRSRFLKLRVPKPFLGKGFLYKGRLSLLPIRELGPDRDADHLAVEGQALLQP